MANNPLSVIEYNTSIGSGDFNNLTAVVSADKIYIFVNVLFVCLFILYGLGIYVFFRIPT